MAINNSKNFHSYNTLVFHQPKGQVPYVSIDTPEGEFRIYAEMEEGYHGFFASFIKRGQTTEQDICMAELNPDNQKEFSIKVWSEPHSEEYQEDIKFGQYIEPRCPYCGNYGVEEVDDFLNETKFFCDKCEKDFLMDNEGKYTTRNRIPLKSFEEKEKEQE